MIIDCNNKQKVLSIFAGKKYPMFLMGSRLYCTYGDTSNYNFAIIVPDDTQIIDITDKNFYFENEYKMIHNCSDIVIPNRQGDKCRMCISFVKESDLNHMIKDNYPFAIELIFSKDNPYKESFVINKSKLKETFEYSSDCSWDNAQSIMNEDMETAVKSIFHSIRLIKLACQIASGNTDINFYECNDLLYDMKEEVESGNNWDFFENKYKHIVDKAKKELDKLCEGKSKKSKSKNKKNIEE